MADSEKKAPNVYDSLENKAKNSWPIAIIIASFAILSGAKGVMESIDYFSAKIFAKKELVIEKAQGASLTAVQVDSARVIPADAIVNVSKKEAAQSKRQPSVSVSETKAKEKSSYSLSQINSSLSKIFRQRSQASWVELDETGKVEILQKNGSYAKFMIQHIRLEWNSNYHTISLVSDKKSIIWHGISTFADGTRGWSTERISGVVYSFSKNDFEDIKQLFAQYRKCVTGRKK